MLAPVEKSFTFEVWEEDIWHQFTEFLRMWTMLPGKGPRSKTPPFSLSSSLRFHKLRHVLRKYLHEWNWTSLYLYPFKQCHPPRDAMSIFGPSSLPFQCTTCVSSLISEQRFYSVVCSRPRSGRLKDCRSPV